MLKSNTCSRFLIFSLVVFVSSYLIFWMFIGDRYEITDENTLITPIGVLKIHSGYSDDSSLWTCYSSFTVVDDNGNNLGYDHTKNTIDVRYEDMDGNEINPYLWWMYDRYWTVIKNLSYDNIRINYVEYFWS